MERPGSQLEQAATTRRRKRPRLCKRCVASVRRKTKVCRSLSLLLTKLLEARILPERIPKRIEFQIGDSDSCRYFEKMGQRSEGGVAIAELRVDLSERHLGLRFGDRVGSVSFDGALRLLQRFFLFAQPGIGKRESNSRAIRIEN